MKEKDFHKITGYIGSVISDTKFENHVYAVGGSVRDLIMGNDIKDIDLVIDLPNGGVELAEYLEKNGYCNNVVIYPTYGTAMFHLNEFPEEEIECVMTRGEKYVDKNSRNPVCVFDTLEADAIRRDLTINAIYYNVSTGEFYDPTGGKEDIEQHNPVKVTNDNPDVVFDDDPLRVMRVVRFATRFNLEIERETYISMMKFVDRLSIISKERIQSELNKILVSENATKGIRTLCDIGAMKYVIQEVMQTIDMEQNEYHFGTVYEHTLATIDHYHKNVGKFGGKPDLKILLSLLLHDIGKIKTMSVKDGKIHFYEHEYVGYEMVEPILKRLKYDNDTIGEVKFLVKNHMRTKNFGDDLVKMKEKSFNKLAYECGNEERFMKLAVVIECDNMSHKEEHNIHGHFEKMKSMIEKAGKMFGYKLPVNGEDVMGELGIEPGPYVKKVLDKILKHAFVNPEIKRESCLKMLGNIWKQIKNEKVGK